MQRHRRLVGSPARAALAALMAAALLYVTEAGTAITYDASTLTFVNTAPAAQWFDQSLGFISASALGWTAGVHSTASVAAQPGVTFVWRYWATWTGVDVNYVNVGISTNDDMCYSCIKYGIYTMGSTVNFDEYDDDTTASSTLVVRTGTVGYTKANWRTYRIVLVPSTVAGHESTHLVARYEYFAGASPLTWIALRTSTLEIPVATGMYFKILAHTPRTTYIRYSRATLVPDVHPAVTNALVPATVFNDGRNVLYTCDASSTLSEWPYLAYGWSVTKEDEKFPNWAKNALNVDAICQSGSTSACYGGIFDAMEACELYRATDGTCDGVQRIYVNGWEKWGIRSGVPTTNDAAGTNILTLDATDASTIWPTPPAICVGGACTALASTTYGSETYSDPAYPVGSTVSLTCYDECFSGEDCVCGHSLVGDKCLIPVGTDVSSGTCPGAAFPNDGTNDYYLTGDKAAALAVLRGCTTYATRRDCSCGIAAVGDTDLTCTTDGNDLLWKKADGSAPAAFSCKAQVEITLSPTTLQENAQSGGQEAVATLTSCTSGHHIATGGADGVAMSLGGTGLAADYLTVTSGCVRDAGTGALVATVPTGGSGALFCLACVVQVVADGVVEGGETLEWTLTPAADQAAMTFGAGFESSTSLTLSVTDQQYTCDSSPESGALACESAGAMYQTWYASTSGGPSEDGGTYTWDFTINHNANYDVDGGTCVTAANGGRAFTNVLAATKIRIVGTINAVSGALAGTAHACTSQQFQSGDGGTLEAMETCLADAGHDELFEGAVTGTVVGTDVTGTLTPVSTNNRRARYDHRCLDWTWGGAISFRGRLSTDAVSNLQFASNGGAYGAVSYISDAGVLSGLDAARPTTFAAVLVRAAATDVAIASLAATESIDLNGQALPSCATTWTNVGTRTITNIAFPSTYANRDTCAAFSSSSANDVTLVTPDWIDAACPAPASAPANSNNFNWVDSVSPRTLTCALGYAITEAGVAIERSPANCGGVGVGTACAKTYNCDANTGTLLNYVPILNVGAPTLGCVNIDDCAGNPCTEGRGTCSDGVAAYTCNCNAGYEYDAGTGTCEFVTLCVTDATCTNPWMNGQFSVVGGADTFAATVDGSTVDLTLDAGAFALGGSGGGTVCSAVMPTTGAGAKMRIRATYSAASSEWTGSALLCSGGGAVGAAIQACLDYDFANNAEVDNTHIGYSPAFTATVSGTGVVKASFVWSEPSGVGQSHTPEDDPAVHLCVDMDTFGTVYMAGTVGANGAGTLTLGMTNIASGVSNVEQGATPATPELVDTAIYAANSNGAATISMKLQAAAHTMFTASGGVKADRCGLTVTAGTNAVALTGFAYEPSTSYNYDTACDWPVFAGALTAVDPSYPCAPPNSATDNDGVLQLTEACDDGNANDNDGCHNGAVSADLQMATNGHKIGVAHATQCDGGTTLRGFAAGSDVCSGDADESGLPAACSCQCDATGTFGKTPATGATCGGYPTVDITDKGTKVDEVKTGSTAQTCFDVQTADAGGGGASGYPPVNDYTMVVSCFTDVALELGYSAFPSAAQELPCAQITMTPSVDAQLNSLTPVTMDAARTYTVIAGVSQRLCFTSAATYAGTAFIKVRMRAAFSGNVFHTVARAVVLNVKSTLHLTHTAIDELSATELTQSNRVGASVDGTAMYTAATTLAVTGGVARITSTVTTASTPNGKQRFGLEISDNTNDGYATSIDAADVLSSGRGQFVVQSTSLGGANARVVVNRLASKYDMCFLNTKATMNDAVIKFLPSDHYNSGADYAAIALSSNAFVYDSTVAARSAAAQATTGAVTAVTAAGTWDITTSVPATSQEGASFDLNIKWVPTGVTDLSVNREIVSVEIVDADAPATPRSYTFLTPDAKLSKTNVGGTVGDADVILAWVSADTATRIVDTKTIFNSASGVNIAITPCSDATLNHNFKVAIAVKETAPTLGGIDRSASADKTTLANSATFSVDIGAVVDGAPTVDVLTSAGTAIGANPVVVARDVLSTGVKVTTGLNAGVDGACQHQEIVEDVEIRYYFVANSNAHAGFTVKNAAGASLAAVGGNVPVNDGYYAFTVPQTGVTRGEVTALTVDVPAAYSTCDLASSYLCVVGNENEEAGVAVQTSTCAAAFGSGRYYLNVLPSTAALSYTFPAGNGYAASGDALSCDEGTSISLSDYKANGPIAGLVRTSAELTDQLTQVVISIGDAGHDQYYQLQRVDTDGVVCTSFVGTACTISGANLNSIGGAPTAYGFALAARYAAGPLAASIVNLKLVPAANYNSRIVSTDTAQPPVPSVFTVTSSVTDCTGGDTAEPSSFTFDAFVAPITDDCTLDYQTVGDATQLVVQTEGPYPIGINSDRGASDEYHDLTITAVDGNAAHLPFTVQVEGEGSVRTIQAGETSIVIVCSMTGNDHTCTEGLNMKVNPVDTSVYTDFTVSVVSHSRPITQDSNGGAYAAPATVQCGGVGVTRTFAFTVVERPLFGIISFTATGGADDGTASVMDVGAAGAEYEIQRVADGGNAVGTIYGVLVVGSAVAQSGGGSCFSDGLSGEGYFTFLVQGTVFTSAAWSNGVTSAKTMMMNTGAMPGGVTLVKDCVVTVDLKAYTQYGTANSQLYAQTQAGHTFSDATTFTHSPGEVAISGAALQTTLSPDYTAGATFTIQRTDAASDFHNALTADITVTQWNCFDASPIPVATTAEVCIGAACAASQTVEWADDVGGDIVITIKSSAVIGDDCTFKLTATSALDESPATHPIVAVAVDFSSGHLLIDMGTGTGGAFTSQTRLNYGDLAGANRVSPMLKIERQDAGGNAQNAFRAIVCIENDLCGNLAFDPTGVTGADLVSAGSGTTGVTGLVGGNGGFAQGCVVARWINLEADAKYVPVHGAVSYWDASPATTEASECTFELNVYSISNWVVGNLANYVPGNAAVDDDVVANGASRSARYDICDFVGALSDANDNADDGYFELSDVSHQTGNVYFAREGGATYFPVSNDKFRIRVSRAANTDANAGAPGQLDLGATFTSNGYVGNTGLISDFIDSDTAKISWAGATLGVQTGSYVATSNSDVTFSQARCGTITVVISNLDDDFNLQDRCGHRIPNNGMTAGGSNLYTWRTGVAACIRDDDVDFINSGPAGGSHSFDFVSSMIINSFDDTGYVDMDFCVPWYPNGANNFATNAFERTLGVVATIGSCPEVGLADVTALATGTANPDPFDFMSGECSTLPRNYADTVAGSDVNYATAVKSIFNNADCDTACGADNSNWNAACGRKYPEPSNLNGLGGHSPYFSFGTFKTLAGDQCSGCYNFRARLDQLHNCKARCVTAAGVADPTCAAGSSRLAQYGFSDAAGTDASAKSAVTIDTSSDAAVVYSFKTCVMAFGKLHPEDAASTDLTVQTSERPVQLSVMKNLNAHVALVGISDTMQLTATASYEQCEDTCDSDLGPRHPCAANDLSANLKIIFTADIETASNTFTGVTDAADISAPSGGVNCYGSPSAAAGDTEIISRSTVTVNGNTLTRTVFSMKTGCMSMRTDTTAAPAKDNFYKCDDGAGNDASNSNYNFRLALTTCGTATDFDGTSATGSCNTAAPIDVQFDLVFVADVPEYIDPNYEATAQVALVTYKDADATGPREVDFSTGGQFASHDTVRVGMYPSQDPEQYACFDMLVKDAVLAATNPISDACARTWATTGAWPATGCATGALKFPPPQKGIMVDTTQAYPVVPGGAAATDWDAAACMLGAGVPTYTAGESTEGMWRCFCAEHEALCGSATSIPLHSALMLISDYYAHVSWVDMCKADPDPTTNTEDMAVDMCTNSALNSCDNVNFPSSLFQTTVSDGFFFPALQLLPGRDYVISVRAHMDYCSTYAGCGNTLSRRRRLLNIAGTRQLLDVATNTNATQVVVTHGGFTVTADDGTVFTVSEKKDGLSVLTIVMMSFAGVFFVALIVIVGMLVDKKRAVRAASDPMAYQRLGGNADESSDGSAKLTLRTVNPESYLAF